MHESQIINVGDDNFIASNIKMRWNWKCDRFDFRWAHDKRTSNCPMGIRHDATNSVLEAYSLRELVQCGDGFISNQPCTAFSFSIASNRVWQQSDDIHTSVTIVIFSALFNSISVVWLSYLIHHCSLSLCFSFSVYRSRSAYCNAVCVCVCVGIYSAHVHRQGSNHKRTLHA